MKRIIPFLVVINLILCSCAGKNNDGVEDSLKEPELYEQIDVPTSNDADKYEETTSQQEYIGNINTGKFHYFTCKYFKRCSQSFLLLGDRRFLFWQLHRRIT